MFRDRSTWILIGLAFVAGLGMWLARDWLAPSPSSGMVSVAEPMDSPFERLLPYPRPRSIDPDGLTLLDGQPFTIEALKGRYSLAFFGFTHCPDICPMALAEMKRTLTLWSERQAGLQAPQILFVSVDPERDSPARLREYLDFFSTEIVGITGTIPALERFTRSVGVLFVKVPTGEGPMDYTIDHSASILVFGPEGTLLGIFRPQGGPDGGGHDPAVMVADLALLMQTGATQP
jgi:protein SCO1/2